MHTTGDAENAVGTEERLVWLTILVLDESNSEGSQDLFRGANTS